jgi:hypothetical protein
MISLTLGQTPLSIGIIDTIVFSALDDFQWPNSIIEIIAFIEFH